MKLLRHLTPQGPAWAAASSDGSWQAIEGEVFGDYRVTDTIVTPGRLLAPVPFTPPAIFGIGLNYRRHAAELGRAIPPHPLVFMKSPNTVAAHDDTVEIPRTLPSEAVDYEGELAVIIGRTCKNATRENALSFIFGYTIANDVSARDWQFDLGATQFCQGKSFDTFCPLGPVLVTPDELGDARGLALRTRVNGELRQEGDTGDLIFDVAALIVFLSASKTLLPGTIILTGTPGGSGHGMSPRRYLRPGDRVEVEIERLGTLANTFANES